MRRSPKSNEVSSEEEIHIMEFQEANAPEIADLIALVWGKSEAIPPQWRKKRILTTQQIIQEMQQGFHYFGARMDGRIVGLYKAIKIRNGLLGEHQTVHPNYRHRGLVRAMYQQFMAYAKQIGAPANLCNILVSHQTMRNLVEGFGFKPEGVPYEQAPGMLVQLYRRPTES